MSVETGFLDVGFLVSDFDARNSTITGTTLGGPNGSGQYLFVRLSTVNNFAFNLSTISTSTARVLGVLQNTPSTGLGGDIKIIGVSKVMLGSTASGNVVVGSPLALSSLDGSTTAGTVSLWASSTCGWVLGQSLESPTAAGQVFSAYIYGSGGSGPVLA